MGPVTVIQNESEDESKVTNTFGTYSDSNNYWAPLSTDDDDIIKTPTPITIKEKIIKCIENFRKMRGQPMVIDSGATSTFVRKETNLPVKSKSNKIVQMPDGRGTAATAIVTLPYPTLTTRAREAHVLPSLNKNSLLSVPVLDIGHIVHQTS